MKLKRLFAAVLSTALALSLCAMPAMAAEGGTTAGTTTSTSTINKDQLGSITIHKYLMDDINDALPSTNGEQTESLPAGALPASGVEFTLYQVKNIDELIQYFDGVTGGFGTLLFSGIGVLLVLAGVGVLFSLKKKSNRA